MQTALSTPVAPGLGTQPPANAPLAAHAAAEERYLYAPILMDDNGLSPSRHALHEHHELDELVEQLQQGDPASRGWTNTARELSRKLQRPVQWRACGLNGVTVGQARQALLPLVPAQPVDRPVR